MSEEIVDTVNEENFLSLSDPDAVLMTEKEAKALTESIKSTATATSILLKRAHDEKAWVALGYKSWSSYIQEEFEFTRARSYQLIDYGKVIEEISEASDSEVYLTEKEAKMIKSELPKITQKIKEETKKMDDELEKQEKAQSILDDEIAHAMATDKDTYDESRDFEAMVEEDGGHGGGDNAVYSGQSSGGMSDAQEQGLMWGAEPGGYSSEEASFYLENLERTLSIVEALPNVKDIASAIPKQDEQKIILRNRVKYAIAWLNSLDNEI